MIMRAINCKSQHLFGRNLIVCFIFSFSVKCISLIVFIAYSLICTCRKLLILYSVSFITVLEGFN
jgi:hypothetical protein